MKLLVLLVASAHCEFVMYDLESGFDDDVDFGGHPKGPRPSDKPMVDRLKIEKFYMDPEYDYYHKHYGVRDYNIDINKNRLTLLKGQWPSSWYYQYDHYDYHISEYTYQNLFSPFIQGDEADVLQRVLCEKAIRSWQASVAEHRQAMKYMCNALDFCNCGTHSNLPVKGTWNDGGLTELCVERAWKDTHWCTVDGVQRDPPVGWMDTPAKLSAAVELIASLSTLLLLIQI